MEISKKKLKKLEKNQLKCLFFHPNDSPTLSNLGMNTTLHRNRAATVQPTEEDLILTVQRAISMYGIQLPISTC
jgi:hypothetical protein